jgi:hypothetical protein
MSNTSSRLASFFSRLGRKSTEPAPSNIKIFNLTRHREVADLVQLAGNGPNRRKGLLGRAGLGKSEGLWIVPCEAVHTFWMRFPIDLIYLDRQYRVLKTRSGVPPWRLSACLRAHSVLELAAGTIRETQTARGDRLALDFDRSPT